ncbi:DUF1329 domain-containing protein [Metapseudomonas resinovorans]|uniref:DUF1329 domain-containing protein n=1 Tax=Metapseudomonas resinovorans TaxID=53412 RepID=UPI00041BE0DB|nr:DUF1329 domain-containing protein [Pseudomonas resinovorans]
MKYNNKISLIALCAAAVFPLHALAAVSASDAERLGNDLTPVGAIKAGNADGSIPAWTGGLTNSVAKENPKLPPKLFSDEKPLFSISASNVDQYASKLAVGTQQMLKNYPGYRLDVYPSHRTAAAPQFIYDRTKQNATTTTLTNQVLNRETYSGGIPFPIPQTGDEAIFNVQWNWRASDSTVNGSTWFVSSSGKRALTAGNILEVTTPHGYPNDRKDPWENKLWGATLVTSTAPAYSAGEKQLVHAPNDQINTSVNAWAYLTGQRRLRKAPNVQYDVPNNFSSGLTNFDDSWGFNGAPDRYQWKLVGKEEMYVPYNANNMAYASAKDLIGEKFVNPDFVRWELHRVWVVEATLKPGARHVVPKRRMYIDEDSWTIVASDLWDAKNQLWKTFQLPLMTFPEAPVNLTVPMFVYNLQAGDYTAMNILNDGGEVNFKPLPSAMFTPQQLERSGVR